MPTSPLLPVDPFLHFRIVYDSQFLYLFVLEVNRTFVSFCTYLSLKQKGFSFQLQLFSLLTVKVYLPLHDRSGKALLTTIAFNGKRLLGRVVLVLGCEHCSYWQIVRCLDVVAICNLKVR